MNSKKILAIFVAIVMVFGSFSVSFADTETATATTNTAAFTDVNGHWATGAIEKWAGNGTINGFEGLFRPDDTITRGEMAVILDNLMDYQVTAANTFTDLQTGQFYTDAVLKANAAGIIKGFEGTVRPTDKITKEEASIMMSRAFAVAEASSTKALLDAAAVSDWAKGAVFGMEAKGYVSGFGGYFNPKANITRAEAVTMINNIVKAYYTTAGTYTDNVEGTAIIKVSDVTLKGVTVSENLIIAEGVGKGDAYLDSVTVKGDTVVRGGGANSIHITGTSKIAKITIEKVGDTIRVTVSDGINIPQVQIGAANEEIIITGSVGTVDVQAPNATVYATAAEIKTATIAGDNSKIVVGAQSTVDSVTVASTAKNTAIQTEKGAVVKAVTASAPVSVTGTGTVTKVTLNEGANGSTVATPNTTTTVGTGVTGVTGGGGTSIPAGSTGTNNSTGTGSTVTDTSAEPSGGGGGGGGGDTVLTPTMSIDSVTHNSSPVSHTGNSYTIPWDADETTTAIDISIGNTDDVTYSIDITVKNENNQTVANAQSSGIARTYIDSLSTFGSVTFLNFGNMVDRLGADKTGWYKKVDGTQESGTNLTGTIIHNMFARMIPGNEYTVTVTLTPNGGTAASQDITLILQ